MASDGLRPLSDSGADWSARRVVRALGLREQPVGERPRVVAVMIASIDGRTAIEGRSVALGHPGDRALLRELRAAVDAVLVGTATIAAERYANLLDPEQCEQRVAAGLEPMPIVATVSRRLDVPVDAPLFAEPEARIQVYTEAAGGMPAHPPGGAWVALHRFASERLSLRGVLEHLASERGVEVVACEGGPRLLGALAAEGCVDDLLVTISPVLAGGEASTLLTGPALDPPRRWRLAATYRADDHLFLHYGP